MRQAVIWNNANPVPWRIYAVLEGDVSRKETDYADIISTSSNFSRPVIKTWKIVVVFFCWHSLLPVGVYNTELQIQTLKSSVFQIKRKKIYETKSTRVSGKSNAPFQTWNEGKWK